MTKPLGELRQKLLTLNLLSRQMMGRIDELSYYTDFFDKDDEENNQIIEYLFHYLEEDYKHLAIICRETKLPEKEKLRDDTER